ncbi:uncharacterized protein LOC135082988 [Ostrinia nubilalis]|uniref:uncharacterized protein LOC135082988 n=1 Tax=Ostrinia nubilalis TaxID=29057 RepID=UPI0030822B15
MVGPITQPHNSLFAQGRIRDKSVPRLDVISSYVTHKNLANFTVRTGSSYNNKGGSLSKVLTVSGDFSVCELCSWKKKTDFPQNLMVRIKMLINNFDMKVSAVKLVESLEFGSRVGPVRLPDTEDEVNLGYLAQIIAWTPSGHIRVVNTPLIEASLCEPYTRMLPGNYICSGGVQDPNRHFCRASLCEPYTRMLQGNYICSGGVQDPNRHFCRRDNGGAVVQNNTLVGISTFLHTCAIYTKVHAFPKVASFSRWVDSVIWDEENRPTTTSFTTTTVKPTTNATELPTQSQTFFADPRKYYVTLPFEPINVPLEPAEDNSVIPRMSLYESYLQSMARAKTSTTQSPKQREMEKRAWLRQFGRGMVAPSYARKYDAYDYN